MDLTNKVAFITGSAGGIGKGMANALLEKGVKVYINDISKEEGEATLKEFQAKYGQDQVAFSVLDVTKEKDFQEVFAKAVEIFGRVDIMVNNAGINNEMKPDATLLVNVGGMMRGTRIAQEHMRTGNNGVGGRIINISSVHGWQHTFACPTYSASKHAVRAYTTCLALQEDKQKQGMQYAALCPDTMEVGLIDRPFDPNNYLPEYWDLVRLAMSSATRIPVSELVEGLMDLLKMENMSGALLMICHEGRHFRKMRYDNSSTFTPDEPVKGIGVKLDGDEDAATK